jgi:hypothetical protein
MLLGAVILKNVQNVNSFQRSSQVTVRQGNPTTVYFQLVDLEQKDEYGQPLRYVPSSGATLTATINAMNQVHVISRVAAQPYSSDDRSVWSLTLSASDRPASGNLDLQLTEGSTIRTTTVANAIIVWSTNSGMV